MPGLDVISLCPLRATSLLWRRSTGELTQTVICKATFDLLPGTCQLAERQEQPLDDDAHWNDDPSRSLYAPSDLVPFKARADVLLVGKAYAPRAQPVRSLVARLVVAEIDKTVEAIVDRLLGPDGQLTEGPWFTAMPLVYERASGGPETWNPVGVSSSRPDKQGRIRHPNLQPVGPQQTATKVTTPPTAFGPLAPSWPAKSRLLGALGASWGPTHHLRAPLPERLDPAWFNAAPSDQQVAVLRADQRLRLENLNRDHPLLLTALPGLQPSVRAEIQGERPLDLRMTCDTLWIDTDRAVCTLTWRGQVPLRKPDMAGRVVVSIMETGARDDDEDEPTQGHTATVQVDLPRDAAPPWLTSKPVSASAPPPPGPSGVAAGAALRAALGGAPLGTVHLGASTAPASLQPVAASLGAAASVATTSPVPGAPGASPPTGTASSSGAPPPAPPLLDGGITQSVAIPPPGSPSPSPVASDLTAPPLTPSGAPPTPSSAKLASAAPLPSEAQVPSSAPLLPSPQVPSSAPLLPSMQLPPSAQLPVSTSPSSPSPSSPTQASTTPPASPLVPSASPLAPPVGASRSPLASPLQGVTSPLPGALAAKPTAAPAPPPLVKPSPSGTPPAQVQPEQRWEPPRASGAARTVGETLATSAEGASPAGPGPARHRELSASSLGVLAASNAAAEPNQATRMAHATSLPAASPPAPARASGTLDLLELLWIDPPFAAKIRKQPDWKKRLVDVDPLPRDDERDPEATADRRKARDRRDVTALLRIAEPTDPEALEALIESALDDGALAPPLVLVAGELSLPFDPVATLEALLAAAAPFGQGDKRLKETMDAVVALLDTPGMSRAGSVAESLSTRVRDAFTQAYRSLSPSFLDEHAERTLLEQRAHQKRTLLGQSWLRGLLTPAPGQSPIPTYLPESLSTELPMYQRFKVRLVAEARLQLDQLEQHPIALRAVALARLVPRTKRP
ncbi:DUF2169 family type VI secretion system accessory protein [Chondromyces crocatus]|uniref:DUF2169 domain-containing protein n=1 Tax=Chondromyces crocatus TaxID=52 RepID=A0A0K1E7B1_CHOCO|nr:DUF2169 domain-containing protein [Chondromyces crocatus]AKT36749.1 uncharacterized protein CMC5_008700 [Chondromyces crocatus]